MATVYVLILYLGATHTFTAEWLMIFEEVAVDKKKIKKGLIV